MSSEIWREYCNFNMKDILIVANWKSNKTAKEALSFIETFAQNPVPATNIKVVICPSYLSVPVVSEFIKANNLSIEIGVQDVSAFEIGSYTGEVAAQQAKEFATYAIIGHSERRRYLGETDQMLADKVSLSLGFGLTPIFCVQDADTMVPASVTIVAYEPVAAIGTGEPDTPENAEKVGEKIRLKNPNVEKILYGGSVIADNVESFIKMPGIDGVLVGGASLTPDGFSMLINKC